MGAVLLIHHDGLIALCGGAGVLTRSGREFHPALEGTRMCGPVFAEFLQPGIRLVGLVLRSGQAVELAGLQLADGIAEFEALVLLVSARLSALIPAHPHRSGRCGTRSRESGKNAVGNTRGLDLVVEHTFSMTALENFSPGPRLLDVSRCWAYSSSRPPKLVSRSDMMR